MPALASVLPALRTAILKDRLASVEFLVKNPEDSADGSHGGRSDFTGYTAAFSALAA